MEEISEASVHDKDLTGSLKLQDSPETLGVELATISNDIRVLKQELRQPASYVNVFQIFVLRRSIQV